MRPPKRPAYLRSIAQPEGLCPTVAFKCPRIASKRSVWQKSVVVLAMQVLLILPPHLVHHRPPSCRESFEKKRSFAAW